MFRKIVIDEFFENQPEKTFQEDLKTYNVPVVTLRECNPTDKKQFPFRQAYLEMGDFARVQNLSVSYADFGAFLRENNFQGNKYPVRLKKMDGFEKEEYDIFVTAAFCEIRVSEIEGARRALIRLQDDLLVNGGNLRIGQTHGRAQIKRRITRCFFSPTNRPPKNGDELFDDIDYYPEGYLNRLMHDGINAIWIYSSFDALVKTSLIPEYGIGAEKRIEKLNSVVGRCKRYGIDVFIFAMEPMSMEESAIKSKYGDIAKKYPHALGAKGDGPAAFCPYTDFAKAYYTEAVKKLFTDVPQLAGLMTITQGERVTTCSNSYGDLAKGVWYNDCPHCAGKTKPEILSYAVNMIRDALRAAKPTAEFISWTYSHRSWDDDMISYYVEHAPKSIALMQNFEDAGRTVQLGKKRVAFDYWLSYVGPSHMFEHTAAVARKYGKTLYAKMQACCSHECASVPYIPAPGIIFDKVTRAMELGVTGIMESWYFGNYPCIMSKAIDLLAFGNRFASKRDFLRYLAGIYWPYADVEKVVDAWEAFEEGYTQYPVNQMFGYYGPMHDGIVWELALLPKNFSLSRSWQLIDKTDGDRIGECLFNGHTIEEAVLLLDTMNENWTKGCKALAETAVAKSGEENEQLNVAKAIEILFRSGRNVMRFYQLRGDIGYGRGDAKKNLAEIKRIVAEEKENCRKMIELCKKDNRLGYHSEAEGFKFHPAKLEQKLQQLDELEKTEIAFVEKRIEEGLPPIPYYEGEEPEQKHYTVSRTGLENAAWEELTNGDKFRVAVLDEEIKIELYAKGKSKFILCNEFEVGFPKATVFICPNGDKFLHRECMSHQQYIDEKKEEELNKWHIESLSTEEETRLIVTLKKAGMGFVKLPYKMMVKSDYGEWCTEPTLVRVLGKTMITPAWFGWLT